MTIRKIIIYGFLPMVFGFLLACLMIKAMVYTPPTEITTENLRKELSDMSDSDLHQVDEIVDREIWKRVNVFE